MGAWRHAWPGLLATLDGVGLCRFAYTPLIPFLVGGGVLTASAAGYLGAANLAGYLAGAAAAAPLAARIGLGPALRLNFVLSALALGACVFPGGFWWYFPWRCLAGAAGAILMVLAPSYLLPEVPAAERGRAGGVIYIGVGAGIALSSVLVPPLAGRGIGWAWAALAVTALLATALTWPRWRHRGPLRRAGGGARRVRLGAAALCVAFAFGMDGIGFVPHMLFWVDFIARDLGLGMGVAQGQWLLFGVGAAIGPALGGAVGDRIGLGAALILAFALKAAAVLLPVFFVASPVLSVSSVIAGAFTPGIAALCAARMTELVPADHQTRAWGFATLVFGLFQAVGAYGMSYAYSHLGSYIGLYAAGAGFEACGVVFAAFALIFAPYPMRGPRAAPQ